MDELRRFLTRSRMGRFGLWALLLLALFAACAATEEEPGGRMIVTAEPQPTIWPTPTPQVRSSPQASGDTVLIPPTDPHISYIGRFDFRDPARPVFDWPGTAVEILFEGASLGVVLGGGENYFNVYVDGTLSVLHTTPGERVYPLAEGLADTFHTVRLVKRTEALVGRATFGGFVLEAGKTLLPPPPRALRRIEFIGDSITTGYGNEGESPTCFFSAATQNVERAYAAMTAQALGAEYAIVAYSGLGVVRNFNDEGMTSPLPMPVYVGRSLASDPTSSWPAEAWQPDAVVVNLGTNDFSTSPQPSQEVFVAGYADLLHQIRVRYPAAHIFAVAGPIMMGPAAGYIETAVSQMQQTTGDERIHFVLLEDNLAYTAVDFGCDWHPNVNGQQKIADQLTPVLQAVMGW